MAAKLNGMGLAIAGIYESMLLRTSTNCPDRVSFSPHISLLRLIFVVLQLVVTLSSLLLLSLLLSSLLLLVLSSLLLLLLLLLLVVALDIQCLGCISCV